MQTLMQTIKPRIFVETEEASKAAGFYIAKADAELKRELQKGIDSGFVVTDEKFFINWKKSLGVGEIHEN